MFRLRAERPVLRAISGSMLGAALAGCIPSGDAAAWGADGHRIIGEIAWRHLDEPVRERIRELLPDGRYRTLYESCVWADSYARARKEFAWIDPLHYIETDPRAERITVDDTNCPGEACVVGAVRRYAGDLADTSASDDAKLLALRLVGHMTGDVHQPLHVRHPDGCGGCEVDLVVPTGSRRGKRVTLHEFWDTVFLAEILAEGYGKEGSKPRADAWRSYVGEIDPTSPASAPPANPAHPAASPDSASHDLDPVVWAQESLDLARSDLFDLSDESALPADYRELARPVLERRLREAGLRLAAILNRTLGGDPRPLPAGKDVR